MCKNTELVVVIFSFFILFSNSVCIFTENPSSSMSSGIDSSIISSRLANSVLLVNWLIACGPVFVQFRQLHPSPQDNGLV